MNTDVSEVLTVCGIRIIQVMQEAETTTYEISTNFYQTNATSEKSAINNLFV